MIIIRTAGFLIAALAAFITPAQAQLVFDSAGNGAINAQSAAELAFERTFEKDFDDVIEDTAATHAVFSLEDSDIVSWEESGQGKYIYFTLSQDKNEELAKITAENIGKKLQLNINDDYVIIPEITQALHQANGFVLMIDHAARRTEIIHSMLDKSKRVPSTTAIIAPAIINVPEIPLPAAAKN